MGLGKGLEHQEQLGEVGAEPGEKKFQGGNLLTLYNSLTGGSRELGVGRFSR